MYGCQGEEVESPIEQMITKEVSALNRGYHLSHLEPGVLQPVLYHDTEVQTNTEVRTGML